MNTIKRHCSQSGWGFQQDPGLELYCSIEGVDRCSLLNTVDNLSSDSVSPPSAPVPISRQPSRIRGDGDAGDPVVF